MAASPAGKSGTHHVPWNTSPAHLSLVERNGASGRIQRGTWNRPVRGEFRRILRGVTVEALPTTAVTGLLIGFALVSQAVYWLAQTGTTGVIGPVIVVLLVREFVPILIGLLLFGRSGTAALVELGEAQTHGLLRSFEVQGLNPLQLLIIPRAFAFARWRVLSRDSAATDHSRRRLSCRVRDGVSVIFCVGLH
jgi:hypothetical protein